tara:strand:- start:94 stop:348 length:255 start_codon:yes stop_codon:yes gene_type:complete
VIIVDLLNGYLWSLGHFIQWAFIGRFLLRNWYIFFFLSISWEILELFLPFEFAVESWANKISDVFVNCVGFYFGNYLWSKKNNE